MTDASLPGQRARCSALPPSASATCPTSPTSLVRGIGRAAYVEAGDGQPILMLHGEPTWGYLYRRMIPTLAEVGRVIVPDLIGFGRSDKPVAANAYSYKAHVRWLRQFVEALDLK